VADLRVPAAAVTGGKLIASAAIVALLIAFMSYFHIASYAYLAWALAGSALIYFSTRPGFRNIVIAVAFAAVFAFTYTLVKHEPAGGALLAFLGLGSLTCMSLSALWGGERRKASVDACLMAAMFPLFLVVSGFSLAVTTAVHPKTYDLFLYAFDAQLGVSPSFLVGRFLARFSVIRQICFPGYESLPLAMAIAFVLDRGRSSRVVVAFTVAAAGGFLLYNCCPAAGPVHVFGAKFPFKLPAAMKAPYGVVEMGPAPRNAMPSVHIAMALLILWNSRRWAAVWRALAGVLVTITVLATLGFGEHYLVDLLVAVPFALFAQGVATTGVPWDSRVRVAAVGGGGALVFAWIWYLRLPVPPLYANGLWAWELLLLTAVLAVCVESRLHRAGGELVAT
jgi:PAP2 superfamily